MVSVSPDYAESTTAADAWLNVKAGSDGALAMAMGHVILHEYYWGEPAEFFIAYAKTYTDMPFLVLLDEKDGRYVPGRLLNGHDMGRKGKHTEFKHFIIDELTGRPVIPNGTMGDRWDKWKMESA